VRQVEERRHACANQLVAGVLGAQRSKQHINSVRILARQVRRERGCDVPSAIEQFEGVESVARILHEPARTEGRIDPGEVRGKTADEGWREEGLERIGHGLRQDPSRILRVTHKPRIKRNRAVSTSRLEGDT
jgi:hypothetical protein